MRGPSPTRATLSWSSSTLQSLDLTPASTGIGSVLPSRPTPFSG
jgi:hypothetical protein